MTPDAEPLSWLRVLVAFITVFGLIGLLGFVLKYISLRGIKLPSMATRNQRLQIIESLQLDVRRRLVIVRRDEKEHLLLLGVNQDIVIESDITQPQTASVTHLSTKSAT